MLSTLVYFLILSTLEVFQFVHFQFLPLDFKVTSVFIFRFSCLGFSSHVAVHESHNFMNTISHYVQHLIQVQTLVTLTNDSDVKLSENLFNAKTQRGQI